MKKVSKIFGGGGKSAYLCTRFREASELPRREGRPVTARGSCYAAEAGRDTDTDKNSETEATQKKLKKNLEVTDFLLTFAKFFRLTKTAGLRTTGSGAGKSPRTLKDLQ